jgi:hypothetical protein
MISLELQSAMDVTIHNQCTNIELTSLVYFTKDTMHCGHIPKQANSKRSMHVKVPINLDTFGGVLLYHLQRKENDKTTSTSTQILVIWGRSSDWFYSNVYIVEHENALDWNKDKLERLYDEYDSQYYVRSNIDMYEWLLDDNIMLKTTCESSHGDLKMQVIISEEIYLDRPIKPLWIDANRQVPTLFMVACVNLIISFNFYFVSSVAIHNQCSDFELTSPVYFGHHAIWHIPPDQTLDANTITRVGFGIDTNKDTFSSALIYKLQRKNHPESDTSLQLLIIWGSNTNCNFSVRVLCIRHTNTITWDEGALKMLHAMYLTLLREDDLVQDTWLLDDTTVLMTTLKWEVGLATEITLSESIYQDDTIAPLWVL